MSDSTIPDAAVEAAQRVLGSYAARARKEDRYRGLPPWQSYDAMARSVLAAALPHLLTDEMVEAAVGGYREVAGRCSRQAMRAALEAALGGAA